MRGPIETAPPLLIVYALAAFALAEPASACACCTNDGQRIVEKVSIDTHTRAILSEIRFEPEANLYTGEADPESIEGIVVKSSSFTLAVSKAKTVWTLEFRQPDGVGTLVFQMPESIARFEVDPRDPDADTARYGPSLYKEWRLTSRARGSGIFAGARDGEQLATLILHGSGNNCTDADQFHAWTLVLQRSKGVVTLYGMLASD